jgi:hypothetical protein
MKKELTTEEILKDVYKYHSKAELTPEEIDTIIAMFDKPEKFVILRKLFQVLTQEERDIAIPSEEAMVDVNPTDMAQYGLQVAINTRADEKIRQALLTMYQKVKAWHVREKENEIKEDEEKKEKLEEQDELSKKLVGDNI